MLTMMALTIIGLVYMEKNKMNEKKLIVELYSAAGRLHDVRNRVKLYFVPLARKAIKEDRLGDALDIMSRCPDEETCNIIADMINRS